MVEGLRGGWGRRYKWKVRYSRDQFGLVWTIITSCKLIL